jgi:hypothetical protein
VEIWGSGGRKSRKTVNRGKKIKNPEMRLVWDLDKFPSSTCLHLLIWVPNFTECLKKMTCNYQNSRYNYQIALNYQKLSKNDLDLPKLLKKMPQFTVFQKYLVTSWIQ